MNSHVVFKFKVEEKGKIRLKARPFLHVNRDIKKDNIRKDSLTA